MSKNDKYSISMCLAVKKLNSIKSIKIGVFGREERLIPATVVESARKTLENTMKIAVPFFYPTGRKSIELIYEKNNETDKINPRDDHMSQPGDGIEDICNDYLLPEFLNIEIFENNATYFIVKGNEEIKSGEIYLKSDTMDHKEEMKGINDVIYSFFNK